jgi:DNA invertase Pin-like site-specific DNA recombinase
VPKATGGPSAATERVVGYIRVSTDDQADSGLGLEAQRAAIVAECERRGWDLADVYEDAGASGKALNNRPALQKALNAVRSHEAGALVVAKLDRLSRSLLDFAALMEEGRKGGWALVILDLGVDTLSPSGEMMANVMATFAQFERRLIGQRTKDALAVKKAEGVTLGRPRQLDEDIRDRIVAERKEGRSLRAIAAGLEAEGVPAAHGGARWHASTIRHIVGAT